MLAKFHQTTWHFAQEDRTAHLQLHNNYRALSPYMEMKQQELNEFMQQHIRLIKINNAKAPLKQYTDSLRELL
jgi:hypothetical protein